jgi:hypothetical protein
MQENGIKKAMADDPRNLVPVPDNLSTGVGMSAERVAANVDAYVRDGRITAEDKALVVWFFAEGKRLRLPSWDAYSNLIGYTGSGTASRLFNGRYEAGLGNILDAIRAYKKKMSDRLLFSKTFFETSVWKEIKGGLDLARAWHGIIRISGPTQIGKTTCLEHYRLQDPSQTVYTFRMPAMPTLSSVLVGLASTLGVSTSTRNIAMLNQKIAETLNEETLLVIDEVHQLAVKTNKELAKGLMEKIREWFDISNFSLCLCGTGDMERYLFEDPVLKPWLAQMDERAVRAPIRLSGEIPSDDLVMVAEAFGFPPPDDAALPLLRGMKMRRYCQLLGMSQAAVQNDRTHRVKADWNTFRNVLASTFGVRDEGRKTWKNA